MVFVNYSHQEWGHKLLKDGSYTGAYGDLQNYDADLGMGMFYMNFSQFGDFDLTFPYMEDSYKWVVPAAEVKPQWLSIIHIFKLVTWVFVLFMLILLTILLYLTSAHLPKELKRYQKVSLCFWISFQCLLNQCVYLQPKTSTIRFIFVLLVYFSWMIVTTFQSHLISTILNFNNYETQISTVQELITSKIKFGMNQDLCFQIQKIKQNLTSTRTILHAP